MKESDRRPFILILNWILVYTSLTMWWMDLYPIANLRKAENSKSQSNLRLLQNIFIQFIWIINYVYYGFYHERVNSFFFSPIIVANVFFILFIKVASATKWKFLKMCHLRCRLNFFFFYFMEKLCTILNIFKFLYF